MVVCQRVLSLNEIATWFDRLTMSGCAPRNDRWGVGAFRSYSRPVWFDKVGTREFQSLFKVVEIKHPLVLSLSKDG